MALPDRIHIPFRVAVSMIWNYARVRIYEQIRSVAFIILYLVAFKIVVLNEPPTNALQVSTGIGMVVLGLALFLEGLFLGLMPLGERVGLQLPQRCHIAVIMGFGLLLGVSATLAEPAIAALRLAGITVTPWETPLLYRLLEVETDRLVMSIGAGVGFAVAFGMVRFYWGVSIKPFIYFLVPVLLAMTAVFSRDENLCHILNLAWDTGGVTTGPVTVPLVLAMGIGVSRSAGKHEGTASGFGIVALASLFPVIGVLCMGAWLNSSTPRPVPAAEFFSAGNRVNAMKLVKNEKDLEAIAFQRGDEAARRSFYGHQLNYEAALRIVADNEKRSELLGALSLNDWLVRRASKNERAMVALEMSGRPAAQGVAALDSAEVMKNEAKLAFRAVVPLVMLLVFILVVVLRDKPRRTDEVLLGILFALAGMGILTSGIRLGLGPLGDQVGRPLPQVFRSETHEEGRIILEPFDLGSVLTSFSQSGAVSRFFYLQDRKGIPHPVPFDATRFDQKARRYEHIVERPPMFGPELTMIGIALVFVFAFGMGYGSTVAEPALSALGATVEDLTVGTVKKSGVIYTVSLGVGMGLVAGVARILYSIPVVWLLLPSYLIVMILTYFSEDDFAGIAWDSGGVTTGPITVPLVLAMGLGIGGELNVVDGFGIVAMASVFPILTMLIYGIIVQMRQRQLLQAQTEVNGDE
ncbi:MAG TPA: DUF1538 domain-containing protein [Candidatus Rifleibacterium sp.]|jgi:hypothetical protein|nr:DUF1538 domain-containing protein [Candidatus Rifleibacterium sp.]HPW57261.1 DUF1538 domain-containing protein [Candidatus Rifleibacterium sp.]